MADPLSIASGVAGLVSLAIEATKLTRKYLTEVRHANESVLQCLEALLLLRDVLDRLQASVKTASQSELLALRPKLTDHTSFDRCKRQLEDISRRLEELFDSNGKVRKRFMLSWPFNKHETLEIIHRLYSYRDIFVATLTADI